MRLAQPKVPLAKPPPQPHFQRMPGVKAPSPPHHPLVQKILARYHQLKQSRLKKVPGLRLKKASQSTYPEERRLFLEQKVQRRLAGDRKLKAGPYPDRPGDPGPAY